VTIKVGAQTASPTSTGSVVPAPKLELIRSGAYLLRQGMQGESVRALQSQLVDRKLLSADDVDGVFGKKTLAAVKAFQTQQKNLEVDGLVGPDTLGALEKKNWGAAGAARRTSSGLRPLGSVPAPAGGQRAAVRPGLQPDAALAQAEVRRAAMSAGSPPPALPVAPPPPALAPPSLAPAPPPPASAALTPDDPFAALPSLSRSTLRIVLDGQAGAASKAALTGLLASPGYQQQSPAGRQRLLLAVQPSNLRASLADLGKLTSAPAFAKVNEADLEKLLSISQAGQTDALLSLGPTLFSKDSQGTRLLDSVAQLATGPMQPELVKERPQLLASALAEVMNPDLMLQKDHNTCAATTAAQLLARSNPAELMRLVAGLASPSGTAKLANNDTLTRAVGTQRPDGSPRSPTQRLVQAALMDYANGAAAYDNERDVSLAQGKAHMGLSHDEMAKLMTGLTGKRYEADSVHQKTGIGLFYKSAGDIFERLQKQQPAHDTMAVMRWDARGHVITVDRIADGRVYFRNPQGNALPPGASYADGGPARRSEGGIEQSMSVADFRDRLMATVDQR
jgi:hypothetical protein